MAEIPTQPPSGDSELTQTAPVDATVHPATPRHIPSRIGRYSILRVLGEGGMGTVYEAQQDSPKRAVALKVIRAGNVSTSLLRRFEHESAVLGRLQHPGIAQVYEAGTVQDDHGQPVPFFAMEFIRGVPLTVYAANRNLGTRERLDLLARICDAVYHAHQKGVIHRDLKPGNILVDESGQPKVLDFGVARATDSDIQHTTLQTDIGQLIGTVPYMSPEQVGGDSSALDTRSDVYALGVIAYELLAGRLPYDLRRRAIHEAARVIREEEPTRLSSINRTLRGDVETIVAKALEKEKSRRYQSAESLASDIRRYLKDEPIAARPASTWYQARKFSRRNKGLVAGLSAAFVFLSAGLVLALISRADAVSARNSEKARADEVTKISEYQAKMLEQVDVTHAGIRLMADLRARHTASLEKSKVPEPERSARSAAFDRELSAVNATDAAATLLDGTLLAPAVSAIDKQFADQPLVDSTLRTTLGVVYHTLGRPEEALALYQRAYTLRATSLGEDHPATLASRYGVGKALGELQKLAEAETTVRATLEACKRVLGADHETTLAAQNLLATQMSLQGKYDECEAIIRDVLERRRRALGSHHANTLDAMKELGQVLVDRGKYADAEKMLREAIDVQRRQASPDLSATLSSLGIVLMRQKQHAAAEPVLREALDLLRRNKGEDHPRTRTAISNLASLLTNLNQLPEAESLARESLDKARRIYGSEHASTLKALNIMGQVLSASAKYQEVVPYYREAMETGRRVLGEDHPETIVWIHNFGDVLYRLGRFTEAEPYLKDAVERGGRQWGETHPYSIITATDLGDIFRQMNRPAEAEVYFRRALEGLRETKGEDDAQTLLVIGHIGAVLREQGKLDQAEAYFQESLDKTGRLKGEGHADTIVAILRMGTLRVAQGKYAEAIALLTPLDGKVEQAFQGKVGPLRQASLTGLLGHSRAGLAKEPGDFAAAESDLLKAYAVFSKHLSDKHKDTREWMRALADLYATWHTSDANGGYDAKAAEWKAKLDSVTPPAPK